MGVQVLVPGNAALATGCLGLAVTDRYPGRGAGRQIVEEHIAAQIHVARHAGFESLSIVAVGA